MKSQCKENRNQCLLGTGGKEKEKKGGGKVP